MSQIILSPNTPVQKQVRSGRKKPGFFEKAFYSALSKSRSGRLDIEFRNEIRQIGTGQQADAVLRVNDERFFSHCVLYGDIGFGEAYVENLWDTDDLYGVLNWFLKNADTAPTFAQSAARAFLVNSLGIANKLFHRKNKNTKSGSLKNISYHYDLSNELYQIMLDETMAYSSACYLPGEDPVDDLHAAQLRKFEMICRKLNLRPENHLLEVGSGWGGFAVYAAKNYGCRVTTVTISKQQYDLAKERIESENLQNKITLRLQDYREIEGTFDRIVSIEMVEALGKEYLDVFFEKMGRLLTKNGIMVIQCITFPESGYKQYLRNVDWTQKHIFPGSLLLSQHETFRSLSRTGRLNVYGIESLGTSYAKTLYAWRKRFNDRKSEVIAAGFDQKFIRLWNYYLTYCETGFANRYINDVQIIFSHSQNKELEDYHGIC